MALTIAVLSGGDSAERTISLKSGDGVTRALRDRGHTVINLDPAEVDLTRQDWTGIDAAFIALHGRFGEDGQVQQILDDAGVPYSGSGVQASRLAFSKSASKERFLQHHVHTPPYVLIHEADTAEQILKHALSLGFPLVVKPDTQGSSLGVTFVYSPDDLPKALTRCFHLDSFGLLEQAIAGTEWTLGVVDDTPLPLIEILTPRSFFDYHAKYEDELTQYNFNYTVPPDVVSCIEQAGLNACRALGTSGIARVDLIVDRFHRPWVLEVNTVPGFTDHSLVPKAAAQIGLTLGELCERTILAALPTERSAVK